MFYHSPLKAKTWSPKSPALKYAHLKYDGHRLTLYRQIDGEIVAYTRGLENIATKLRNSPWWTQVVRNLPYHTSVDGELLSYSGRASDVKTAINEGRTSFIAFAVPVLRGEKKYDKDLTWAHDACTMWGLPFAEYFELGNYTIEHLEDIARRLRVEGFVFKQSNYLEWYKYKLEKTIDAVVVELKPGAGKYADTIGSLICAVTHRNQLITVANVGGMTDEVRYAISLADVGRVCEIEYQCVGAGGRLRHPRFIRWRDDKQAAECLSSQDPDLEEAWNKVE